ncbi:MAG: hypothetical protein AB7F96_06780 [Beijerinckiaceae bacterium]
MNGDGPRKAQDDRVIVTPEQARARRRRNIAIAVGIALFAIFFYVLTIAKLGVGVLNRSM